MHYLMKLKFRTCQILVIRMGNVTNLIAKSYMASETKPKPEPAKPEPAFRLPGIDIFSLYDACY